MIKHRDIIILVTFNANGKRYEDFALQSADYAFVQSVNPHRYKFVDMKEIKGFLAEEKKRILDNIEDDWSYFKHFVLGDHRKQDGTHLIGIWERRKKHPEHICYNDIIIERVVAYDKANDSSTDITKEFCDVWYLGKNPTRQIQRRYYKAVIEFPATLSIEFSALDNMTKKELEKKALETFWKETINTRVCNIADWKTSKVANVQLINEDE